MKRLLSRSAILLGCMMVSSVSAQADDVHKGKPEDGCFLDSVSGLQVRLREIDQDGNYMVFPYPGGYTAKPRKREQLYQCLGEYKDLKVGDVVSARMGDGTYVNQEIFTIFENGQIWMKGVDGYPREQDVGREVQSYNGIKRGDEYCVLQRVYDGAPPYVEKYQVRKIFSNGVVSLGEGGFFGAFAEYSQGADAHIPVAVKDLKTCDQITVPADDDWKKTTSQSDQSVKTLPADRAGASESSSSSGSGQGR